LIVVLAMFYPKYVFWFLFLIALDIISHFARIYSTLAGGQTSHKVVNPKCNPLLKLYYTNRYVLAFLCGGNEGFFVFCYLLHFWSGPLVAVAPVVPFIKAVAPMVTVTALNQVHLVPLLLVFFFFPVMAYKQLMNVIQLQQSAIDIVELDDAERAEKAK